MKRSDSHSVGSKEEFEVRSSRSCASRLVCSRLKKAALWRVAKLDSCGIVAASMKVKKVAGVESHGPSRELCVKPNNAHNRAEEWAPTGARVANYLLS